MTFGSLFAGIGGMDLGLERAGMECRWQVEIDGFARKVLAKHWPDVRRHDDVRTFPPPQGDWNVDLIAGGFPCQDISFAGKGAGLAGERSGLWYEFARVIRDLRPRYVLVENVAALLVRGLDAVLGTLASFGYDAEWSLVSAASVGLPQARDRMFVVAYRDSLGCETSGRVFHRDACRSLLEEVGIVGWISRFERGRSGRVWAAPESGIHGMADGLPDQLDRLRGLGNAVVPQVAEWIGRRIIEFDAGLNITRATGEGD